MAISVTPVLPVQSAQEVAAVSPELVLTPGTTINATVLKVLSADLVRIAIASLSIDVKTESGIRLTNVTGSNIADVAADAVTLSPEAMFDAPTVLATSVPAKVVLTP